MTPNVNCAAVYLGCWNAPSHMVWSPYGTHVTLPTRRLNNADACFAPVVTSDGKILFGIENYNRNKECPQGHFLRHEVDGWSLIQWWDRNQGDHRGRCNSTILLRGTRTSEELLLTLSAHFPHVARNLTNAGVVLKEVFCE